jgi:hypothetical protein
LHILIVIPLMLKSQERCFLETKSKPYSLLAFDVTTSH